MIIAKSGLWSLQVNLNVINKYRLVHNHKQNSPYANKFIVCSGASWKGIIESISEWFINVDTCRACKRPIPQKILNAINFLSDSEQF